MIKSELANRIFEKNLHLNERDVQRILNAVLDEITEALSRGDRVELRGFGAFSVKGRPAHTGRNPRSGVALAVPRRLLPSFRPGKEMRLRLNGGAPPSER